MTVRHLLKLNTWTSESQNRMLATSRDRYNAAHAPHGSGVPRDRGHR